MLPIPKGIKTTFPIFISEEIYLQRVNYIGFLSGLWLGFGSSSILTNWLNPKSLLNPVNYIQKILKPKP